MTGMIPHPANRQPSILVIDDDAEIRLTARETLEAEGCTVEEAGDGPSGLDALARFQPDLVLLDVCMSDMDGFEVCARLRRASEGAHLPILMMTDLDDAESISRAYQEGATDFIAKPFNPCILGHRVRYMLRAAQILRDLRRQEARTEFLAYYDNLTGLPNRTLYHDRLNQAVIEAQRHGDLAAVLLLDLDRFKLVNESWGHQQGDAFLKEVADRLQHCIRLSDSIARRGLAAPGPDQGDLSGNQQVSIARLGGDEFTLLLTRISGTPDAAKVAHRISTELAKPFQINGQEVFVTASIGIAIYPLDGDNADQLLKNADTAMYHAKARAGNNFQFYSQSMNAAASERLSLENQLRKGLDRNEFFLHYQPVVALSSGRILGVEALVRWQHPEMGLVPPAQFIPIAEETGLIVPLGEWVLRTACAQARVWHNQGFASLRVAVNLSARQFQRQNLSNIVTRTLLATGLNPRCLELELTESLMMADGAAAVATLKELQNLGVTLAMDDFGTGYSSLSYLRQLPLDRLKIDRAFVKDCTTNQNDATIASAIVAMAHSLKLHVLAEGIETEPQLDLLRTLGCEEGQGYLFSRPVPAERLLDLLQAGVHRQGLPTATTR